MWAEGGACLVGFVIYVWVLYDIRQGYHCFGSWIPLGLVHLRFLGGILGSGGEWGEVEPYSI